MLHLKRYSVTAATKKTRAWEKLNLNCETLFEQNVKGFLKNMKTDFTNRQSQFYDRVEPHQRGNDSSEVNIKM